MRHTSPRLRRRDRAAPGALPAQRGALPGRRAAPPRGAADREEVGHARRRQDHQGQAAPHAARPDAARARRVAAGEGRAPPDERRGQPAHLEDAGPAPRARDERPPQTTRPAEARKRARPGQRSILRMERGSQQHQLSSPGSRRNRLRLVIAAAAAAIALGGLAAVAPSAHASCAAPGNEIEAENCLPGTPQNQWDVSGMGDSSIQGFATEISVPQGGTVHFKIDTDAASYQLEIYRMGYYGGDGARLVATRARTTARRPSRPARATASTGLTDCGNWAESASWAVPADRGVGDLLRQGRPFERRCEPHRLRRPRRRRQLGPAVPDVGHDLAGLQPVRRQLALRRQPGRARLQGLLQPAVHHARDAAPRTGSSTPSTRWSAGSSATATTSATRPAWTPTRAAPSCSSTRAFLSVGHDEYWSGTQRANVEAARNAGVDLAFFSGNEVFWKTRWENNHRTLVTYKETHANAKIDPTSTWTGTWRDPRFSPPADGGRPENALTGTIFTVNAGSAALEVPAADGKLRLWRGTSVAQLLPGGTATLDRRHASATSGTRTSTTASGRRAWSACRPRPSPASTSCRTTARTTAPGRPPTTSRCTATRTAPGSATTRSCSAAAPCSGRGDWTPTTTAAARRRTRRCSRRP